MTGCGCEARKVDGRVKQAGSKQVAIVVPLNGGVPQDVLGVIVRAHRAPAALFLVSSMEAGIGPRLTSSHHDS